MKRLFLFILVCLCAALPLSAGRYAGDFMMIGAGARPLGMGGAFVALANEGSAIYWNPAGIAGLDQREVTVMHAFMYSGLASYNHIGYIQNLPNDVCIGANLTRLTVSDIPYFDEKWLIGTNVDERINNSSLHLSGDPDGRFRSEDDLYQFAFAKRFHYDANMGWLFFDIPFDFYFGGNVKFIKRSLQSNYGSGTGLDFGLKATTDLGVIFDMEELGMLDFGVNFQDVSGTTISWDTPNEIKDEVLFNTKMGIAVRQPIIEKPKAKPGDLPVAELVLAYDYDYVYNGTNHFGAEFNYLDKGSLRMGFYDKNFSAGATVQVYGVKLDYALITNPIGISNRLGLRVNF